MRKLHHIIYKVDLFQFLGIGLIVIPLKNDMDIGILKFNSWRLYCLIFTILSLFTAIIISQLPESPRLLSINGQTQKCLKILKIMFVKNTGKPEQSYKVKPLIIEEYINLRY